MSSRVSYPRITQEYLFEPTTVTFIPSYHYNCRNYWNNCIYFYNLEQNQLSSWLPWNGELTYVKVNLFPQILSLCKVILILPRYKPTVTVYKYLYKFYFHLHFTGKLDASYFKQTTRAQEKWSIASLFTPERQIEAADAVQ